MAVLNSTILEKAWLSGTNDYQQRIPNPDVSSYAEHVAALFDPMNNDLYNQFSGMLVGLMGTYVESKLFENPLRNLKKPAATWGNSERRVAVRYLDGHTFMSDSETLLKVEKPEFREFFYSVTSQRRYEFSWSKYEMQRVFAADGYGYDDLLAATISQMYSSDNYDEMNLMIHAFAEADERMGGLFRYNLSAAPTDEATGKELLTGIRAIAGQMQFPTMLFNHIDIPVFENPETLILWVTPLTLAQLDVQALSAVFQLDKADIKYRIITIPEFPIPDVYAALTSEDFIYARDVYYGVEPPFYNPENMTSKYYLQHAQMLGANPVANCVLFTTDAATGVKTITMTPSGILFNPDSGTLAAGDELQTHIFLQGTLAADDSGSTDPIAVEPDAALYTVTAVDSNSDPVALNSRTYVDDRGILHTQKTLEAGTVITITAKAAYINPSGATTSYTDDFTATIV